MKRKKVVAQTKTAAAPAPTQPRARQTNVKQMILDLIARKPSTYSVLIREGNFSKSAFQRHITTLIEEGIIVKQDGLYTLKQPLLQGEIIDQPVILDKPKTALVKRTVSTELSEALADLASRLSPIERVEEKLHVLEHVASLMTPAIAFVIREVMADLAKLSKT